MESLVWYLLTCSDGLKRNFASFCAMFIQNCAFVNWEVGMAQEDADMFAEVGARLAISRSEIGVSQAAMAEAIGVSHRAYHSYEKGKRGIPIEALIKMHRRYEVDVAWLLLGTQSIRAGHDFDALKRIETSLDQYLEGAGIKIRSEKRGAIVARWYQSQVEGREVTDDDVHTWIELVRE